MIPGQPCRRLTRAPWLSAGTGGTFGLQILIQRKFPYPMQWSLLVAVGGYYKVDARALAWLFGFCPG